MLCPGSLTFQMSVSFGGHTHVYRFGDHGNGNMSAPSFVLMESITHPEFDGSVEVSGLSATVDYITGVVQVAIASISGSETWSQPIIEYVGNKVQKCDEAKNRMCRKS